ncbi:LuxR C-terminal-related transcriptional regulator [Micromonospora sp. DT233]|uniref:helix-turn-helix transcriptional regulator n=1 Tax=Micromonospora sp. DT233 TaxID=3393432 RepID=UPI003CED03B9
MSLYLNYRERRPKPEVAYGTDPLHKEVFDHLLGALERAEGGRTEIIDLRGDVGSGKTWLLRDLVTEARRRGDEVLTARGIEGQESFRRIQHVLRGVTACSRRGKQRGRCHVIVLDDFHRAGEDSVAALDYLLRESTAASVLIVVSRRPHQTSEVLSRSIRLGLEAGTLQQITVGPLDLSQSATLLQSSPNDPMIQRAHRTGAGNPLLVLAVWIGLGGAPPPGCPDVPERLHALVADEMAPLTETERRVAISAAVLGKRFSVLELATVAELNTEETCAALDGLTRRAVLQPLGSGSQSQFRSPLLSYVFYAETSPGWRYLAHRRALRVRSVPGVPVTELARHIEHAPAHPDLRNFRILTEAARSVVPDDPQTAARWFKLAADNLPEDDRDSAVCTMLLVQVAEGLTTVGDLREARDILFGILSRTLTAPGEDRTAVVTILAQIVAFLGAQQDAATLVEAEIAATRQVAPVQAARMIVGQATFGVFTDMLPTAADAAWALSAAEKHGDPSTELGARALVALHEAALGQYCRAEALLAQCESMLSGFAGRQLADLPGYFVVLGWAAALSGRLDQAERYFGQGLCLARSPQRSYLVFPLLVGLSHARRNLGRLEEAKRAAAEAGAIARQCHADQAYGFALALESLASVWLGGADEKNAVLLAEQATRILGGDSRTWSINAQLAWAFASWLSGEPQRCVTLILAAGGGWELPRVSHVARAACYELLAACAVDLGDARVEEWADLASAEAEKVNRPLVVAHAVAARAHVQRARSQFAEAIRLYQRSAHLHASAGYQCLKALMLLLAATCAVASEDRTAVVQLLPAVVRAAEGAGATRILENAGRLSREAGCDRGGPPECRGDPFPAIAELLTEREQEVARIAATGMRSREISQVLHLSTRTVDVHLSRIYRKLQINGRVALVRLLTESGVHEPKTG